MRKKDYLKGLREVVGGNKRYMLEILDVFVVDLPQSVLSISQCINEKNWIELEKACHRIKSPLFWMQFPELHSMAEKLERNARERQIYIDALILFAEFSNEADKHLKVLQNEREGLRTKLAGETN
jgi:HPt (histidine-containing phosphotransfer) domain-containing protein